MLKDNEKLWKVKSANLPKTPKGKRNRVAKYTILQIFKHSDFHHIIAKTFLRNFESDNFCPQL